MKYNIPDRVLKMSYCSALVRKAHMQKGAE